MPRKPRGPAAGGDPPEAALRELWYCIGTITARILAVDLLQKQPAQSTDSRLGCSVKPLGLADPIEEDKVGSENRRRLGISAETRSRWLITRCKKQQKQQAVRDVIAPPPPDSIRKSGGRRARTRSPVSAEDRRDRMLPMPHGSPSGNRLANPRAAEWRPGAISCKPPAACRKSSLSPATFCSPSVWLAGQVGIV